MGVGMQALWVMVRAIARHRDMGSAPECAYARSQSNGLSANPLQAALWLGPQPLRGSHRPCGALRRSSQTRSSMRHL